MLLSTNFMNLNEQQNTAYSFDLKIIQTKIMFESFNLWLFLFISLCLYCSKIIHELIFDDVILIHLWNNTIAFGSTNHKFLVPHENWVGIGKSCWRHVKSTCDITMLLHNFYKVLLITDNIWYIILFHSLKIAFANM